ncbi:unnamed protein product, partial [Aphanomyces euteiches]
LVEFRSIGPRCHRSRLRQDIHQDQELVGCSMGRQRLHLLATRWWWGQGDVWGRPRHCVPQSRQSCNCRGGVAIHVERCRVQTHLDGLCSNLYPKQPMASTTCCPWGQQPRLPTKQPKPRQQTIPSNNFPRPT